MAVTVVVNVSLSRLLSGSIDTCQRRSGKKNALNLSGVAESLPNVGLQHLDGKHFVGTHPCSQGDVAHEATVVGILAIREGGRNLYSYANHLRLLEFPSAAELITVSFVWRYS